MQTDRYQDLYYKAWKAQNAIDVKANPLMAPNPAFYFGKPHTNQWHKKEQTEEMKIRAALVAGKNRSEIAQIIGKSERTIGRRIAEIRGGYSSKLSK
jgi:DNA-binding NarL/FixJ family response regulator